MNEVKPIYWFNSNHNDPMCFPGNECLQVHSSVHMPSLFGASQLSAIDVSVGSWNSLESVSVQQALGYTWWLGKFNLTSLRWIQLFIHM